MTETGAVGTLEPDDRTSKKKGSGEVTKGQSDQGTQSLSHSITQSLDVRKDRLVTLVGLLREAWRHLRGAVELRRDQRLLDLMDRASEVEAEAGQEILALAGNVAAEPPRPGEDLPELWPTAYQHFRADCRPTLQEGAGCNISGVLAGGETLESGPLSISVRGPAIEVVLRERQTIILGAYPSGLVGFHAMTDGRDYPEIVRPSAKCEIGNAKSAGEQPLVSFGQGETRVDVRPEDLQ